MAADLEEAEQLIAEKTETAGAGFAARQRLLVSEEHEEERIKHDMEVDAMLREGEALLALLPDTEAKSLVQVVDNSSNALLRALRSRAQSAEEDALYQAELLLAAESVVGTAVDAAIVADDLESVFYEGETLLSRLPDSAARSVLEDIYREARATSGGGVAVTDMLRRCVCVCVCVRARTCVCVCVRVCVCVLLTCSAGGAAMLGMATVLCGRSRAGRRGERRWGVTVELTVRSFEIVRCFESVGSYSRDCHRRTCACCCRRCCRQQRLLFPARSCALHPHRRGRPPQTPRPRRQQARCCRHCRQARPLLQARACMLLRGRPPRGVRPQQRPQAAAAAAACMLRR
jgi:hypothetical protein